MGSRDRLCDVLGFAMGGVPRVALGVRLQFLDRVLRGFGLSE